MFDEIMNTVWSLMDIQIYLTPTYYFTIKGLCIFSCIALCVGAFMQIFRINWGSE